MCFNLFINLKSLIMRALILFTISFFCTLSINILGQSGWTDQTPVTIDLTNTALQGIWAGNSEDIWVVGQGGTILHTTNGGEEWTKVNTDYNDDFSAIIFLNSNVGLITGTPRYDGYAFYLKTIDGGENWTRTHLPGGSGQIAFDLDFYYSESTQIYTVYATGGLGMIWKSVDMGENWDILAGGCENGNFLAGNLVDENNAWFVGEPSTVENITIMNTVDGGSNFAIQENPNDVKLCDVSFVNSNIGIAVGLENQILQSLDGGANWTNKMSYLYHNWWSCDLKSSGKAWAVGKSGKAVYSTDFGATWEAQTTNQTSNLWKVYFIDDTEGWILGGGIGASGLILHTTSGGIATDINQNFIESYDFLDQNYPNPVITNTYIKYQIQYPGKVIISLYDMSGNKLEDLVNENKSTGTYTFEFINTYPSGIYLYELRLNSKILQTRKMTIKK